MDDSQLSRASLIRMRTTSIVALLGHVPLAWMAPGQGGETGSRLHLPAQSASPNRREPTCASRECNGLFGRSRGQASDGRVIAEIGRARKSSDPVELYTAPAALCAGGCNSCSGCKQRCLRGELHRCFEACGCARSGYSAANGSSESPSVRYCKLRRSPTPRSPKSIRHCAGLEEPASPALSISRNRR
jgi:hypothetical protein